MNEWMGGGMGGWMNGRVRGALTGHTSTRKPATTLALSPPSNGTLTSTVVLTWLAYLTSETPTACDTLQPSLRPPFAFSRVRRLFTLCVCLASSSSNRRTRLFTPSACLPVPAVTFTECSRDPFHSLALATPSSELTTSASLPLILTLYLLSSSSPPAYNVADADDLLAIMSRSSEITLFLPRKSPVFVSLTTGLGTNAQLPLGTPCVTFNLHLPTPSGSAVVVVQYRNVKSCEPVLWAMLHCLPLMSILAAEGWTVSSRRTLARCVALSFADTVVATFLDALLYDSSMLVMEGILTIVMVVS
mmetsp:Transcript_60/g.165  ORF Transcript_60/g.165 Transcript_60/m.165 type:complete len:303 (+) Transcript_60:1351-2259(+)